MAVIERTQVDETAAVVATRDPLGRLRDAGIGIAIVVMFGTFTLVEPRFAHWDNVTAIGQQTAIFALLAAGETLVILTRNIDLSVGSTTGLSAMVVGIVVRDHRNIPTLLAVALAVALGLACGIVNGLLVAVAGIPAIVATLGTLSVIRMLVFLIGGNQQISADQIPSGIEKIATTSPLHIAWLELSAIVIFVVGAWYLTRTRSGRYFYAVGSSPQGAVARGLPVRRTVVGAFALSGAIAGLAGFMYLARFGTVEPGSAGVGYELFAITAVVVGGTSILGGSGGMVHTFFGVLLIGVMNNGLAISGLSDAWQTITQGVIILLAILVDSALRARALSRRQVGRRRFA